MSLDQDVKTTLEKLKQVNSDQATKSIEAKERPKGRVQVTAKIAL